MLTVEALLNIVRLLLEIHLRRLDAMTPEQLAASEARIAKFEKLVTDHIPFMNTAS